MSNFTKIAELIALTIDGDETKITPQTAFSDLDLWDSVAAMRLIPQIEAGLSVRLPIRKYLALTYVGELVALVEQEMAVNE